MYATRVSPIKARRGGAAVVIAVALAVCGEVCAADVADATPARAARPNVVLMMADDLGWGDVGFNGNATIKTPHLDKMAGESLVMRRFYAAGPVCSPTRGSCLTGRHPYRYGIYSANVGHMKPAERTLPELLRELGYATGHFGKWHLGTLSQTIDDANRGGAKAAEHFSPPWANGFDRCFSTESKVPTWDPMLKPAKGAAVDGWPALEEGAASAEYGTHYWDETGQIVRDNLGGDDSRVIMDRVVPFIEEAAAAKRPFFAVVWFHAPHLPVVAGSQFTALYPDASEYERNYCGCITALDEQVGRLRAKLRELGVAERTIVFFASDNGPEGQAGQAPGSAGPLRGRKRGLYEGGVRVPAIVEWPGRIKPGATDFPAVTSDYLPTLLELAGGAMPDDRPVDGVSLVPMLDGRMTERPRPIAFRSEKQLAISDNRHKLISVDGGESWSLYDLIDDPGETTDIAAKRPLAVKRMRAAIDTWVESCKHSDLGGDYPEWTAPTKPKKG